MTTEEKFIYSRPVLDFVTIGTEYCKYLEQQEDAPREKFIDIMRGLLPMLYLKVSLIGQVPEEAGYNDPHVTEADYNCIRAKIARIMGDRDDYLDVFVEDFKYSDRPVLCTVSEDMADIYQSVRELVEAYRTGFEESMLVALHEAVEQFENYWGQRALNALRALHDARFGHLYE